ncbi:hypothetical protein J4439_07480 [Candidatus Woesearchaeota archaeon]|nr:hypothetical protein [Candidatus Woesearchaeota archaeon]
MATLLESSIVDLGILEGLSAIFMVILVFVLIYALLQKTQALGGKPSLDAFIAIAVSMIMLISSTVMEIIAKMTPILVLLLFMAMFLLIATRFIGVEDSSIVTMLGGQNAAWWFIVVGILVFLGAAGQVVGPLLASGSPAEAVQPSEPGATGTGDYSTDLRNTLFHPTFLGMIVLLLIGSFTVRTLVMK